MEQLIKTDNLIMKKLLIFCLALLTAAGLCAQEQQALYEMLNLDYPGLEKVKQAADKGDWKRADKELLKYYRARNTVKITDIDMENVTINKEEQKWADESLEHKFHAHKGYESYLDRKSVV